MVAGLSPLAGTFTDKTDVFGKFLRSSRERSGGSLSIEIETVVVNDQTVVVLSHHTAAHGGRTTRRARDRRVRHPWRSGRRSPQHEHRALRDGRLLRRRVTRPSDPPAQFELVGIRCHDGMAGKPPQPTNAIDLTGGDQTTAIWATRLCGWMAVKAGRRPSLTRYAGSISQTMISVSGGLP
jgi:hypothetical protein